MTDSEPTKLLLCISGGIAAYKTPELVRRLRDAGFELRCVRTDAARHFVTATALQAVSGHAVRDDLWDEAGEAAMSHIELARWADLILLAPATANTLAKLATGMADNLVTTLCLASNAPLLVAPAMNRLMWAAPATVQNLTTLQARGTVVLGPGVGDQACGEVGAGRMLDVPELVAAVVAQRHPARPLAGHPSAGRPLAGQRIVLTAGPTREAIDPVRYLSNHSSGKMGFAIAGEAAALGARVQLISGPVSLPTPAGVERIDVISAQDMAAAADITAAGADAFFAVAAVADVRPSSVATEKLKKDGQHGLAVIELTENPDIVATVAKMALRPTVVVAFAAESQHLLANAEKKCAKKSVDFVAANLIVGENGAFGSDDNQLTLVAANGKVTESSRMSKAAVAKWLLEQTLGSPLDTTLPTNNTKTA